ncbi:MAG: cell division protein ZapE, partial [Caulobacterales bacterium]
MTRPELFSHYREHVDQGRFDHDPVQEEVAARLSELAESLVPKGLFGGRKAEPKGLYIWGPVGRGKSMLMDLFFDSAPEKKKRRVHFHAFMLEIHKAITERRKKQEGDPIQPVADAVAKEARLLCFDEFHVTDIGDAMILGRLFERFFAKGVIIVATSNRKPSDLYLNGINRQLFLPFIDMIEKQLDVLTLDGPRDYRLERLEAEPVWHAPLGAEADAALDRAWSRLTFGSKIRPLELDLRGRMFKVPAFAAGVARASFDDLCAKPLGAEDYLALAQSVNTLILDHVPILSADRRDVAKRFVTLIDALYETRTKLVASAAAQPD